MLPILTYPNDILRQRAKAVECLDTEIKDLVDQMAQTMYSNEGVGLAAPQVGISKRIIVLDIGEGLISLINPEILKKNEIKELLEEGCLSLPETRVEVTRATEIIVKGMDENGEFVEYHAKGLFARAVQHEMDHLDGKLIIDYASSISRTILHSKLKKMDKRISN